MKKKTKRNGKGYEGSRPENTRGNKYTQVRHQGVGPYKFADEKKKVQGLISMVFGKAGPQTRNVVLRGAGNCYKKLPAKKSMGFLYKHTQPCAYLQKNFIRAV
jgi:hypothetical protein